MLFSGLAGVAVGSYAGAPPQAERTQSHRPQGGELLAKPALHVAHSISFSSHIVCVPYNTHALQGFSSRVVSFSPNTKGQATFTQRQLKTGGGQDPPARFATASSHRLDIAPFTLLSRHASGCNFDIHLNSRAPGAGSISQAHRHGRVPVAAPHRPADLPRRKENRLRAPLRRSNDRQALLESLDHQYGWNRPSAAHHRQPR